MRQFYNKHILKGKTHLTLRGVFLARLKRAQPGENEALLHEKRVLIIDEVTEY